ILATRKISGYHSRIRGNLTGANPWRRQPPGNSSTTVVCCSYRGAASCRQIGCVTEPRMPREARDSRRAEFDAEALPHLDHLYSAAFYLCGDRDRADDLVQETFLRPFRFFILL